MELLQFLGTIAPNLAPTLLIAWLSVRLILEFLKERRELMEAHRAERKEWREALDALVKDYRTTTTEYRTVAIDFAALGRDLVNQLHTLKGEITKYLLDEGRRKSGSND